MCAGETDCMLIILHDVAPGLCPLKDRNTGFACGLNFRVIIVNGSSSDDTICAKYIFGAMADINRNTGTDQVLRRYRRIHIGTGNLQTHTFQNKSKRTHGNAADSN